MPKVHLILGVALTLTLFGNLTAQDTGVPKKEPPKLTYKLPSDEVIAEWKGAGLVLRTVGISKDNPTFLTSILPVAELNNPMPEFSVREMKKGASIATLSDPKVPFGIFIQRGNAEELLKGVEAHENLRVLCLPLNGINDKGIEQISGLKNLEYLDITSARITDNGMKEIAKIKSLKFLNLSYVELTDKGLLELTPLENLEILDLNGDFSNRSKITGAGLQGLTKLKKLKHLVLWNQELNDADIQAIKDLKGLESLDLTGVKITANGLKNLFGMKEMKRLRLSGIAFTPEEMKGLVTAMPKLESISLSHQDLNDECMVELGKLKNLKKLQLGENSLSKDGLKPFYKSETLETLYAMPFKEPAYFEKIGELKSLKNLALHHREVSDKEMKEVAKLPKLETLRVAYTKVTDKGLEELHKVKTLKELDLENTPTTIEGINALRKALPDCKVTKRDVKLD